MDASGIFWMEVSGKLHATATLPLGKEAPVPFIQETGYAWSYSGCCVREKNHFPLQGIKPGFFDHPAHCSIRPYTSRLTYPGFLKIILIFGRFHLFSILVLFTNSSGD
jgi:hypothetical protein